MRDQLTALTEAYAPDANRAGPDSPAQSPEWHVRWLALLMFFLLEPFNAVRLFRSGGLLSVCHERPDLPPGSAQAEAAAIRGHFGNAIAWMCRRHGIGPGHAEWPELSRAIVAFGGSLEGFRAGAPACGLQWWENPNIVPGMVCSFSTPAAASTSLLEPHAAAGGPPPAPNAVQTEAAHARLPASWSPATWRHVFARAGPGPSTGPPGCPGPLPTVMSDARGRSMASPAVLIRAGRKSSAKPGTAHTFSWFDPLTGTTSDTAQPLAATEQQPFARVRAPRNRDTGRCSAAAMIRMRGGGGGQAIERTRSFTMFARSFAEERHRAASLL
jgi:hypothetical protein